MSDSTTQKVGRWIGETAGIAGGAVAGGLLAGPGGAAAGAVAGEIFKTTLGEMADRMLSKAEIRRTNTLADLAAGEIRHQIDAGKLLRPDGFFGGTTDERSPAEEVFEGVFQAAQRDHEEKKLELTAKMLARFAFAPTLDRYECNLLTRLSEHLSYRQLCLLSLFNLQNRDIYQLRADPETNPWNLQGNDPRVGVLQEVLDLHRQTLVQQTATTHSGTDIMLDIFLIAPARTQVVAGLGGLLTELMDLASGIPFADRDAVALLLA